MSLSTIVNVNITRQTQTVSQAGFGSLLILSTFKNWNDRIRQYYNMSQVATDFPNVSQDVYQAALAVFSQPVSPPYIYVGRRQADNATINVITAQSGSDYTATINGSDSTITAPPGSNNTTVTLSGIFDVGATIAPTLNGIPVGTVVTTIQFSSNFLTGQTITPVINGTAYPVAFITDHATTLAAIVTAISGITATVNSCSATAGSNTITVNFKAPTPNTSNNVVNSCITSGGVGIIPTATITWQSFVAASDTSTTMGVIATAILNQFSLSVATAVVSGGGLVLSLTALPTQNAVMNSFLVYQVFSSIADVNPLVTGNVTTIVLNGVTLPTVTFTDSIANTLNLISLTIANAGGVSYCTNDGASALIAQMLRPTPVTLTLTTTGGASQPTWTYTFYKSSESSISSSFDPITANQVSLLLTAAINANGTVSPIVLATNSNGTVSLTDKVSGVAYSLSVSTNISSALSGVVSVLNAITNTNYQVTINGTQISYNLIPPNTSVPVTNEFVVSQLVPKINLSSSTTGVVAVDNSNGTFTLSSLALSSGVLPTFVCTVTPNMQYNTGLTISSLTATESVTTSLDAIKNVNSSWYGLACTDRTSGTVQSIAAWAQTQLVLFGTASNDLNIINQAVGIDTTSIAAIFNNLGYTRSWVIYNANAASSYADCAWFGNVLPLTPGSETWMFKTLVGITVDDLSATQNLNCLNKKCNNYQFIAGASITQQGTVGSGEYIDIIRGIDWLTSNIQTSVYSLLVNSPKVPYTDSGITAVEGQIKSVLDLGVQNNFLSANPYPVVTVPLASSVPPIDKANRVLNGVTFQATAAGAIQMININGTLSL